MAIVIFNPVEFRALFSPEFDDTQKYNDIYLQEMFSIAELFVNNSETAWVTDVNYRGRMLSYVTAHLAYLNKQNPTVVGAITSAVQGTVSASMAHMQPGAEFWNQTQYGVIFWSISSRYRLGSYVAVKDYAVGRWS